MTPKRLRKGYDAASHTYLQKASGMTVTDMKKERDRLKSMSAKLSDYAIRNHFAKDSAEKHSEAMEMHREATWLDRKITENAEIGKRISSSRFTLGQIEQMEKDRVERKKKLLEDADMNVISEFKDMYTRGDTNGLLAKKNEYQRLRDFGKKNRKPQLVGHCNKMLKEINEFIKKRS